MGLKLLNKSQYNMMLKKMYAQFIYYCARQILKASGIQFFGITVEVCRDHIGLNICIHHFRSLAPFPNI